MGKEKISLGSVVLADLDFNVLTCFSSVVGGCFRCQNLYVYSQDAFSDPDG